MASIGSDSQPGFGGETSEYLSTSFPSLPDTVWEFKHGLSMYLKLIYVLFLYRALKSAESYKR